MKQVFVDGYMKEICEKSKNDTVQLNHDGTWQEVEDKNEKCEEIGSFVHYTQGCQKYLEFDNLG